MTWLIAIPAKGGRLAEIVGEVRVIFREAVQSNPNNVMDTAEDTIPAAGLHFALNMVVYTLFVEMGDLV